MTNKEALEKLEGIEYVADVLKVNHKIGSRDIANQEIKEMVDRLNYRIPIIKQALLKAQEQEKVLEIIKKKCSSGNSNLWLVSCLPNYERYIDFIEDTTNHDHDLVRNEHNELAQEEFDLLKNYCNKWE